MTVPAADNLRHAAQFSVRERLEHEAHAAAELFDAIDAATQALCPMPNGYEWERGFDYAMRQVKRLLHPEGER